MNLFVTYARRHAGATCILALAILAACTSSSPRGSDQDAGQDASHDASTFPQCTATQACVGYPSFGDWVCLDSCGGDAGDCPSGETCQGVSGCCTGTGCSAVIHNVCVASDAGTGGDAAPDAPTDGNQADGDGGFPQCTSMQACVGYPSFGDWVCLDRCGGDAGDCPSGMTCQSVSGCCTGTGCSATSAHVCVATDADAGDATSDAPTDGNQGDGDGGFPHCTATQACVGYPSFGDWVCLDTCGGPDAGDCPSGKTCQSVSGCCNGTGCTAVSAYVCVTP